MSRLSAAALRPRKTPKQARSGITLDAIQTATIQVLLSEGVGRLTTARVAERAGVSIGTMYQYYPHKQALLFAMIEQQLETVTAFMLEAARGLGGQDVGRVAEGMANAWLEAKTTESQAFRALYSISAEFDLEAGIANVFELMTKVMADLLAEAPDSDLERHEAIAFMLTAMIGGSVRIVLDSAGSPANLNHLRRELPRACRAYVAAAMQAASD